MTETLIKAVTCNIPLGDCILDAYMLPDGEKRLGIENVVIALGYPSTKTFFQKINPELKSGQFLKNKKFSGKYIWVAIDSNFNLRIRTISIRDFVELVTYESIIRNNKKAIALLAAFAETGIEKVLDEAFAKKSIHYSIFEKIVHYKNFTEEELEEAHANNREDAEALKLPGDE